MNILLKASLVTLICGLGAFQVPPCGGNPWIKQIVVVSNLRARLPHDLKGHLYLDIYPAKKTADPAKQDFELVMDVRDDSDREIGVSAVRSETVFRGEAANYFHYLLRHKVRPADIPQSYLLELDLNAMEKYRSFVIAMPPVPGPACIPTVVWIHGGKAIVSGDSAVTCKCPPGKCTGCPVGLKPGIKEHSPDQHPSNAQVYYSQFTHYAEQYKVLKN